MLGGSVGMGVKINEAEHNMRWSVQSRSKDARCANCLDAGQWMQNCETPCIAVGIILVSQTAERATHILVSLTHCTIVSVQSKAVLSEQTWSEMMNLVIASLVVVCSLFPTNAMAKTNKPTVTNNIQENLVHTSSWFCVTYSDDQYTSKHYNIS